MTLPLVQLGPGGAYATSYVPAGSRLVAISGEGLGPAASGNPADAAPQDGGHHNVPYGRSPHRQRDASPASRTARSGRLLDRLLGIDRVELSADALKRADRAVAGNPDRAPAATPARIAAASWLGAQRQMLEQFTSRLRALGDRAALQPSLVSSSHPVRAAAVAGGYPRSDARKEYRHESHAETTPHPATDSRFAHHARLFPDDAGARRRARHQQGHRLRARRGAHQKGRPDARAEQGALFVDL